MIHEIIPNLYLGAISDVEQIFEQNQENEYVYFDVRGLIVPSASKEDNRNNAYILAQKINVMLITNKKVLVYCDAGMERSPLVVMVYLLGIKDMGIDAAYDLLIKKRGCVQRRTEWIQ